MTDLTIFVIIIAINNLFLAKIRKNIPEDITMAYEIAPRPFLLYETVSMLYQFVNGISCRSTLSLHLRTAPLTEREVAQADGLQQILEQCCKGLSPADPRLRHFFSAVNSPSPEEGTCLAYLMVFSFLSLKKTGYRENVEAIRSNWRLLQEKGAWVQGCTGMSLLFSYGPACPGDLLDQICTLDLPAAFQLQLCRALNHFDEALDELAALMEPVARRLEKALQLADWIFDDRVKYWTELSPLDYVCATVGQDVFSERVTVGIFLMSRNVVLLKQSESDPAHTYLYIGYGASVKSQRRDPQLTCEMMSQALKSFSDKKRLEILCRLSREQAYSFELAEAMHIDPSNMSRSLSQLCSFGFLKQRKEGQKIFYETDKAALRHFLQQLERFILD